MLILERIGQEGDPVRLILERICQAGDNGSVLEDRIISFVLGGEECSRPEVEGAVCSANMDAGGQGSMCSPLDMSQVEEGGPLNRECKDTNNEIIFRLPFLKRRNPTDVIY